MIGNYLGTLDREAFFGMVVFIAWFGSSFVVYVRIPRYSRDSWLPGAGRREGAKEGRSRIEDLNTDTDTTNE